MKIIDYQANGMEVLWPQYVIVAIVSPCISVRVHVLLSEDVLNFQIQLHVMWNICQLIATTIYKPFVW